MKFSFSICILFTVTHASLGAVKAIDPNLTPLEKSEVDERLSLFYGNAPEGRSMDKQVPKIDTLTGRAVQPNPQLKAPFTLKDPLLDSSGKKASEAFHRSRCEHLFKGKFPFLNCDQEGRNLMDETSTEGIEELTNTWIAPREIVRDLNLIPNEGQVERDVWSGDYWRMQAGLTSYRYAEQTYFDDYHKAVDSYQQPGEWNAIAGLSPQAMAAKVLRWSPAEKYDLLVGDQTLTLTQEQKNEGSKYLGDDDNVESWFGLCHGWAPASFMVPVPHKPFQSVGAKGTQVTWYPDDVRAMATLAWANGRFATNFVGGRCNHLEVERYDNGRLTQPECFDNNPSTFHLAMGNMLGKEKTPVIMDSSFDYQVWNQPILSYKFEYFNPLHPKKKGGRWEEYAVAYDASFKAKDRFQNPLTRGKRSAGGRYDDSRVAEVVGVVATVVYLRENSALFGPESRHNSTVRVTYTYDLELEKRGDKLIPTGGEWHENQHPDFLWVPEKGSVARLASDETPLSVDLKKEPGSDTRNAAEEASRAGYPLCQVLEQLVAASSGVTSYRCQGPAVEYAFR